ncbi:hypothetical protein CYMTET_19521 [Cymbomonas tetramitiformis]|uniref:Pesticidal crystal protein Cry22Aa Ig-like domain-containing protein n=1 Tax=Cymbomonas tetramitiformis TaxID=36881 RepID=A0AAE0G5X2_9CHLO|nr:hypothetical protein CYMTET_19521 [Cymbomonas tetramitiformis]
MKEPQAPGSILACKVDTDTPGVYTVIYEVHASSGLSARVSRNVTVVKSCPTGEKLCSSQTTCSEGGTCTEDLSAAAAEEPPDEPPILSLVTNDALPSNLFIRQHSTYEACRPGQEPEVGKLCEPGAEATDDVDGNLTGRVLSCPPESCLDTGCPGHEFVTKGIEGCLDTAAEAGTTFQLEYVVFDDALPPNVATVTRLITISKPCDDGFELCEDLTCSSLSCADRDMLLMEEAEARRRRHLLQEEDETTEMEALSSNASIEGDTGEVDEVDAAVLHAEMMAELEAIGKGMEEMAISVNLAQAMVEEHSEGPREAEDERRTRVQDAWAAGYGAEAENIQTFSGSLETALENADKILDSLEALNEDLTETANEAAADAQAMENAFVESQEDGGDAATSSPPPVQPASVAATPFSPHLPPISPPASPQCPPPPPLSSIPFPPPPETGCSGNASSELQLAPLEYHFSVPPPKDKSEDVLNSSITDSDGSTSGTEGQPAARRLLARSGANVATKSTGASGEDDSTDAAGADGGTRSVDGQTVDASEVTQVWRGVARRNQLLVGMLLSTWRRSSAMCTERFPQLAGRHSDGTCYAGNYETSPFGSDATFNTVTDLFEQEVFEKEEDYYNLTTEVSYNNKTDALTAHPFQPHLGDASDVFLNASLSAKRAIQILDFLDISAYLNSLSQTRGQVARCSRTIRRAQVTQQIREHLRLFSVVLAAFNRWLHTVFRVNSLSEGTERLVRSDQESIFVLLTLIVSYRSRNLHTYPGQDATARFTTEFLLYNAETRMYSYVYVTFTRELGGGFQSDIKITLLENYLLKSFHLGDAVVVLLSVLLVYLSIQLFYRDIAQLQCLHRNTVSLTKICIEFFTSWTFASSLLLMSFLVCLYSTLYAILNIVYENEHAVYKDEYALSNYFDIETDDGITEVRRFMGTVAHVARLKSLFLGLSLLASLGNLCRLLDAAECHARLNVVSCTIRVVSSQLTHFLCVMFWITAAFAMLAHLTLGPTCTAYADLATAAVTMGDNLMG